MGDFVFITGGTRSGKSRYAVEQASKRGPHVVFIATCTPLDKEMENRIARHRKDRPRSWKTIEEPLDLVSALKKAPKSTDALILDCLTIWISNLIFSGLDDTEIIARTTKLSKYMKKISFPSFVVSNEVGAGIVPENGLARRFRDVSGRVNQIMAAASDEAIVTISGIPLKLKGKHNG